MSDMAQQFTEALTSSAGGEASDNLQERIDEIQQEKNAEIRDLREERDELKETVEELQADRTDLREQVAELEEYEQAVEHMDELREAVTRMNDALGLDVDGGSDRLREKLQKRDETIADLREKVERLEASGGSAVDPLEDYESFLDADAVRTEIDLAKEEATCSPRYVKGVLAAILQEGGPVDYDTIAERLGVSTTSDVSKAASELERRKIITKDQRGDGMHVDLNIDGINEVRRAAAEREKAEELMDSL
jgi:chromosome segregation ATPase